ncbi:hypothetical protein NGRA_2205 [Nosema granulosis]|uniref:Uncharacterized protein n=1 Tax=Nosema granulosis TaxID=83296 RepID=A0A9P6GXY6_9MICR|nr:hypothetical protein NGRA_2205 [Nosema granulosis]
MAGEQFDIRNLFNKKVDKKPREDEIIFDIVESTVERKRLKKKKQKQELNYIDSVNIEIPAVVEHSDSTLHNLLDFEILKQKIVEFNFDCRYIYNFNNNIIEKVAYIDDNTSKISLLKGIEDDKLATDYIIGDDPKCVLEYSKNLEGLDKLIFLEKYFHLKDLNILKEVIETIKILTEFNDTFYKSLILNLPEAAPYDLIFEIKRDVTVLKMALDSQFNSLKCKKEYLTFLNKAYIEELKISTCSCTACTLCKIFPSDRKERLFTVFEEAEFYNLEEDKKKLAVDEFLTEKLSFLDGTSDSDILLYVMVGFNSQELAKNVKSLDLINIDFVVLGLLIRDRRVSELDTDIVLKAIDKVESLVNHNNTSFKTHYSKYEDLKLDFLEFNLSLKKVIGLFKEKEREFDIINKIAEQEIVNLANFESFYLPYKMIFLFNLIIAFNKIPNYMIYKVYEAISKYLVPETFFDRLFKNQNDCILHLIRAKELFKLYLITNEKEYALKAFKYLDKKAQSQKSTDRAYRFRLLKAKFLLLLNQPVEAYLEIKKYKTLDTYKILAYSDLDSSINELKKAAIGDLKAKLLAIELQIRGKEQLAPGFLFSKDSFVDENIVSTFEGCDGMRLSYIRYLKHRDIIQTNRVVNELTKDKRKKLSADLYYEIFIIKRKLKEISYRFLYTDRKSDLLNQEIRYVENKDCDVSNKFYYLFAYKKAKKSSENVNFSIFLREALKGNGDCLVILFILNYTTIECLGVLYTMYNINNGFYWSRTRKILNFKERICHTKEMIEFDQSY